jgi:hypothetical protein
LQPQSFDELCQRLLRLHAIEREVEIVVRLHIPCRVAIADCGNDRSVDLTQTLNVGARQHRQRQRCGFRFEQKAATQQVVETFARHLGHAHAPLGAH